MGIFGSNNAVQYPVNLYALFDRVVGEYMSPVPAVNDATAIRMIRDTLRQRGQNPTPIQANPSDHALFRLGAFDPKTGRIHSESQPELVVQVGALIEPAAQ